MKFRRLFAVPVGLALLYLLPVNLVLNLPAAQGWLNGVAPERFAVSWRRAWSLYPLRVELRGLAADGQSASEQWQVDAARAAASVSLLPLLRDGTIRVHDLDLEDLDVRLRPLPTGTGPPPPVAAFWPVIRNRDPAALAEPPPSADSDLRLVIDAVTVRGRHAFWIAHVRGNLPGEVQGSLSMDAGAGRLGLAGGALDLRLADLTIGDDEQVIVDGGIRGRVEIPPFVIAQTSGLALLKVPTIDLELDLPVQDLDFLPFLLGGSEVLGLQGRGRLQGRLKYREGELLGGSRLAVDAHALALHLGRYGFSGDGRVELLVDPADEALADLTITFDAVTARLGAATGADGTAAVPAADPPLFVGRGLSARLHTRTASRSGPNPASTSGLAAGQELRLTLDLPSMAVPDLRAYDRLLPDKWSARLRGGSGVLSGRVELAPNGLDLALDLGSDNADVRWREVAATSDLLLQLRARIAGETGRPAATLDLTGTTLRLAEAAVHAGPAPAATPAPDPAPASLPPGPPPAPWQAALTVEQGVLRIPAVNAAHRYPMTAVFRTLADEGFGALLGRADGRLKASLTLSRLFWIADLLHHPLGLDLRGAEELDAEVQLADGLPVAGTRLRLPPAALTMDLLAHRVEGQGSATLTLEQADKHPRLRLAVGLADARLRRLDEAQPAIGAVRLDATVLVTDPLGDPTRARESAEVTLKLHSARVSDMGIYNAYLPPGSPLALVGGAAALNGELALGPRRAKGMFLLQANDLAFTLPATRLTGDLRAEVLIRDGSASDLRFDITGSSLTLDRVRVAGGAVHPAGDWHGRLQLEDTEVVWHKPLRLNLKAGVTLRDSRPFVALLDSLRGTHPWLDDLLTVENLAGHLRLRIDGDTAVLEDLLLSAARLGVHAKGRAGPGGRVAMLLVRWHSLLAGVEIDGERRHFDVVNALARFDAWRPANMPLPAVVDEAAGLAGGVARPLPAGAVVSAPAGASAPAAAGAHPAPHHRPRHDDRAPAGNPFLDFDP